MKNHLFKLAALLLPCPLSVMAQVQKEETAKDKKIKAEITQNEKHRYNIKLGSNNYAFLK